MKVALTLRINGEPRDVIVPVHKTLLEVLREDLGLAGTKHGCELGECGTCSVLVDGKPVLSCLTLPVEVQDKEITTVEGLAYGGRLHPLQEAFSELGAAQCGYCTPGILVSAKALLDRDPAPTREAISQWLAGNLCRCTGYLKILEAVELAADRMRGNGPPAPSARAPVGVVASQDGGAGTSGPDEAGAGRSGPGHVRAGQTRAGQTRAGRTHASHTGPDRGGRR